MSERDMDAIDASLRRQFEPPNLDALGDRIEAIANAAGEDGPPSLEELNDRVTEAANSRGRMGWVVGVAAAAVAAAVALIVLWPETSDAPAPAPKIAVAPTSHQIAGRQLDDFLRAGAYREHAPDPADCSMADPPPPSCIARDGAPTLPETPDLRLVWECGGETGVDCEAHDLPAKRMMIVRLVPADLDVILCIEPPGADPKPELPGGSKYNIFRRTLGEYVLYEVTPLEEPRAFNALTI